MKRRLTKNHPFVVEVMTPKSETPFVPEHLIMAHILPRLPVKSLSRFKCVSTHWLPTISSPQFAKSHLQLYLSSGPPHQFITFDYREKEFFLLRFGNDEGPRNKVKEVVPLDFDCETQLKEISNWTSKKWVPSFDIVGSCHGLVCLYAGGQRKFIVWNPATRVCREIFYPASGGFRKGLCTFGFGCLPSANDYVIFVFGNWYGSDGYVYSSGSEEWAKVHWPNEDIFRALEWAGAAVVIDEDFYWMGYTKDIVSFNLVSGLLEKKPQMEWVNEYQKPNLFKLQSRLGLLCKRQRWNFGERRYLDIKGA